MEDVEHMAREQEGKQICLSYGFGHQQEFFHGKGC